jgi:hypothetical protein
MVCNSAFINVSLLFEKNDNMLKISSDFIKQNLCFIK